jgi:hypothetical protein
MSMKARCRERRYIFAPRSELNYLLLCQQKSLFQMPRI